MNHCAIQQKHAFVACEERRSSVVAPITDRRDPVVCPKPRRYSLLTSTFYDSARPLRWQLSHQADIADTKAGTDLLDIILSKGGGYGSEQTNSPQQIASSPPFYRGSPPRRVANPIIKDVRFGDDKPIIPISPLHQIAAPVSSTTSVRKGGYTARADFGNNPAVRVEGFDCLDRDNRRNHCSIPARA